MILTVLARNHILCNPLPASLKGRILNRLSSRKKGKFQDNGLPSGFSGRRQQLAATVKRQFPENPLRS